MFGGGMRWRSPRGRVARVAGVRPACGRGDREADSVCGEQRNFLHETDWIPSSAAAAAAH